jgi:hypothetical protein
MNFGTFAGFILTLVIGIITTYYIVTSNLDQTITDKINDEKFLEKIVKNVRLPFLIFDENETYIVDGGAANLIKKINIIKEGREIIKIILTLNKKMPVAPILISLNNNIQFFQAEPNKESGWEYRALQYEMVFQDTPKEKPPLKLFKIDIIDIKNL